MKFANLKVISQLVLVASVAVGLASCGNRTILPGTSESASSGDITVWFVKPEGEESKLVSTRRPSRGKDPLESSVTELLAGPTTSEATAGLGTEIPRGTILLGLRQEGDEVELNLSRRFSSGGGSSSWETRLTQLRQTVQGPAAGRKIYLNIEGNRLSTAAGDGLEIRQPINWL